MRIEHIISTAFLAVLLSGCATKARFPVSRVVPGADASATIKNDKHGNSLIRLNVANLAAPERLDPPRRTYVVWALTTDGTYHNLGALNSKSSSKSELRTTTPQSPSLLIITAEDQPQVVTPFGQEVLRSEPIKK